MSLFGVWSFLNQLFEQLIIDTRLLLTCSLLVWFMSSAGWFCGKQHLINANVLLVCVMLSMEIKHCLVFADWNWQVSCITVLHPITLHIIFSIVSWPIRAPLVTFPSLLADTHPFSYIYFSWAAGLQATLYEKSHYRMGNNAKVIIDHGFTFLLVQLHVVSR